jgi:hypothetical protein
MDKAREQHNTLMDKGSEQLTAFGVSCYTMPTTFLLLSQNLPQTTAFLSPPS